MKVYLLGIILFTWTKNLGAWNKHLRAHISPQVWLVDVHKNKSPKWQRDREAHTRDKLNDRCVSDEKVRLTRLVWAEETAAKAWAAGSETEGLEKRIIIKRRKWWHVKHVWFLFVYTSKWQQMVHKYKNVHFFYSLNVPKTEFNVKSHNNKTL